MKIKDITSLIFNKILEEEKLTNKIEKENNDLFNNLKKEFDDSNQSKKDK